MGVEMGVRGTGAKLVSALLGVALMLAAPAMAQQTTTQRLGLKLSGDQPIQIESDRLDVNEQEAKAIFAGNVSVVQGATMLKAARMTVFYVKQGDSKAPTTSSNIERLEVDGKVYLKSEAQVATGDHGTFDMKTEVLTLAGEKVVLSEGANVLMGCKLTVQMKTGQAKFERCANERIKTLLTPGSQSQ
jgi:lipopolysaccharide export system protein LptA